MSGRAPTLQFLGGAGTVTGSKFLVETGASRVLVDCGLFQGLRELREQNWEGSVRDPASIDAVVLTHAHVDHCGYLPRLVGAGFQGRVHASQGTADLARIVLPDCGHLQEEEAEYANRKGFSRHDPAEPLYTEADAWAAVELLAPAEFHDTVDVAEAVSVVLAPAGHILGSASVSMQIGANGPRITFSGDLGRPHHPILRSPAPPAPCDWLLVESTYGDRRHDDAHAPTSLRDVICRTVERGGSVLIPAFAVDRTEIILHRLGELSRRGELPTDVPVYVDSPMALDALHAYRRAFEHRDLDIERAVIDGADPFDVPGLHEVRDVETSKTINRPDRPSVIVSASGMLTGGRVIHHLAHLLPDPRNSIVLVGYQAAGTRGRALVEAATELKLLGRYVPARAEVINLAAFSAHADGDELERWIAAAPEQPTAVYLVHGEPSASATLAARIRNNLVWAAVVPRLGERVRLDVSRPRTATRC